MGQVFHVLHYVVEFAAVVAITVITVAYMSVGGFETPIILGSMGAIASIAAYDIYKREKGGKS